MSCVPPGKRTSASASTASGVTSRSGTASRIPTPATSRDLEPNQRRPTIQPPSAPSSRNPRSPAATRSATSLIARPELEPEPAARREREQVRQLADAREARPPQHLLRLHASEAREVELDGLGRARHVVDAEDDVLLVAAQVREDLRVRRPQRLVGAEPEDGVGLAQ